jgi:ferric-dicitrate binding protein FerR (iron transport regulator)
MSEGPDEHGGSQGDEGLRRLIRLTRETLSEDPFLGDESGLLRLREERDAPSPPPRVRWTTLLLGLAAAGAVAAGVVAWRVARPAPPLTFEIIQGTARPHTAEGHTRIHFSDGSEIVLEDEARAEVRDLRADGSRVVLLGGRARATVVPHPRGRWQIAAGPYLVEIAGTAFDIDWSDEAQALELWLHTGSLRVSGPLIGSGMAMSPGQHLLTRVRDNKIVLDSKAEEHPEEHQEER